MSGSPESAPGWRSWLARTATASLVAAFAGTLAIIVLIPLLWLPPFLPVALLMGLSYGLLLALPVTALLLPLAERRLAGRARLLVLPLLGLAGGALTLALAFAGGHYWVAEANYGRFVAAGAIGGLAAGVVVAFGGRKRPVMRGMEDARMNEPR